MLVLGWSGMTRVRMAGSPGREASRMTGRVTLRPVLVTHGSQLRERRREWQCDGV
jgi:hypothetical protein